MNLYCIKCPKFTNKNGIKIKWEINGKCNLYSFCIGCAFQTFDKNELSNLLKSLNYI